MERDYNEINYPGYGKFKIYGGSEMLDFRAKSFLTKEPTTLEWLQSLDKDSMLIDVGANIGIYTIPASLFHVKKVIAIEPEIKNYNMLLDNLGLNKINCSTCEAIPAAVSTKYANTFTKLYLTEDSVGASCHQLGRNQDFKLRKLEQNRAYRTVSCISLSQIISQSTNDFDGKLNIKIDVDGIEYDVCESLFEDKSYTRVSTLQIELNEEIEQHETLIKILKSLGFVYDKRQVERAIRKKGTFKGFAEYVFKRNMNSKLLYSLPEQFSNWYHLSNSDKRILHRKSERKYFNENQSIIQTSRLPASYIIKNLFNTTDCSELFHLVAEKTILEDSRFTFEAQEFKRSQESNKSTKRYQAKPNVIDSIDSNYNLQLQKVITNRVNTLVKKAIKDFRSIYFTKEHIEKCRSNINDQKIAIRVRHFIDIHGFSLGRHHDSTDTLCAVIAPIFPYSTCTSLIGGLCYERGYMSKINSNEITKDEFIENAYYATNHSKEYKTVTYLRKAKDLQGNTRFSSISSPYTFSNPQMSQGEALVIPNPRCALFSADGIESMLHLLEASGHGVLPGVKELYRPVLLIDYLLLDGKQASRLKEEMSQFIMPDSDDYINDLLKI